MPSEKSYKFSDGIEFKSIERVRARARTLLVDFRFHVGYGLLNKSH